MNKNNDTDTSYCCPNCNQPVGSTRYSGETCPKCNTVITP